MIDDVLMVVVDDNGDNYNDRSDSYDIAIDGNN